MMSRTRPGIAARMILGLGLATGCRPAAQVEPIRATRSAAERPASDQRCLPFAGVPSDVDLRGLARSHAPRCCPSDYGFDPELARTSCGFAEYLGESEELACVHRFRAADGQVHELRLTPILDLELADAVALHESGEFGPDHVGEPIAELPEAWISAVEDRRWALLPGWSIVRRLAWDEAACSSARMLPTLARMHTAPDDPAAAVALPRIVDEPASVATDDSLLELELAAPAPDRTYPLPRAAPQLVHDLLAAAVAHDRARFVGLLDPGARIGLPDRRQLGATAIDHDPDAAADRLLAAAARLPASTSLRCPTLDRRLEPEVARGEHLMWCFWISADALDLLVVGLRGRVVDEQADARVAYLGVFPVRPVASIVLPGEPPPPPAVPTPTLVCGDPHAIDYPGVCPEPELESGEDTGDYDDEGE